MKIIFIIILFVLTSFPGQTRPVYYKNTEKYFLKLPSNKLEKRLLIAYGSLWVNYTNKNIFLPPYIIFPSEKETANYQSKLLLSSLNSNCSLQSVALEALRKAQLKAKEVGLSISPRGTDSCLRSYKKTDELWLSRVNPNLNYYVKIGKLNHSEAQRIKNLSRLAQINEILRLEDEKKLSFDKYRNGSILSSVAAPGSSQHLSGLAFDVSEYSNKKVRQIMNEYGWFQTVVDDLPHFTYLGLTEKELEKRGLKSIAKNGYIFWIPDI